MAALKAPWLPFVCLFFPFSSPPAPHSTTDNDDDVFYDTTGGEKKNQRFTHFMDLSFHLAVSSTLFLYWSEQSMMVVLLLSGCPSIRRHLCGISWMTEPQSSCKEPSVNFDLCSDDDLLIFSIRSDGLNTRKPSAVWIFIINLSSRVVWMVFLGFLQQCNSGRKKYWEAIFSEFELSNKMRGAATAVFKLEFIKVFNKVLTVFNLISGTQWLSTCRNFWWNYFLWSCLVTLCQRNTF